MSSYLGSSLKYPIVLSSGKPEIVQGNDLIQQSIINILSTPVGSTFFNPDFGSRLHLLLFETNEDLIRSLSYTFVKDALEKWEGRIRFLTMICTITEERLDCAVTYRVLASNEVNTFVFPYYKNIIY